MEEDELTAQIKYITLWNILPETVNENNNPIINKN